MIHSPDFHRVGVLVSIPMVLILPPACSSPAATSIPGVEPLAGEPVLYYWADYMPRSVLNAFTAGYEVQVTSLPYDSMEEAIAQLMYGEFYDIALLESCTIKSLAAEVLLAEINYPNVPNFINISPNFRDLTFDPGNRYSIPYDNDATGLLVRNDLVDPPITHWADLWDPRFAGKIAVRPLAYELIGVSLKSLGYPLNSEDPRELEMALQQLVQLKPSLIYVDADTQKAIPTLLSGEAVVMVGWSNDALSARKENENVAYLLPEEGTILWGESFVIPANSPNKRTAELFLNFLLRPEISAQITNENRYATANETAYPLIDPNLITDPIVFPPANIFNKSDWYLPLSPDGETLYANIWERFLAAQP